ncbi:MAG: alkaline phosphatase [Akkermansia sp.]|nr:alkaline phosphatase [Akkermansia sp.]
MKKMFISAALLLGGLLSAAEQRPQTVDGLPSHEVVEYNLSVAPAASRPKNVILMIGDGMGSEQLWAAWLCNRGKLFIQTLPQAAFLRTPSANRTVTDSAAAGTAIACGQKTNNGMLGLLPDGTPLKSLSAVLRERGMRTGLVVTKAITDATPAAFYAHVASRRNTPAIAAALTTAGFDVVLGGGAAAFSEEQLQTMSAQGADVELFAPGDCPPASRRGDLLPRCTQRALERLANAENGFFLMIEGSRIDSSAHDNKLEELVREVLDFDQAVGVVLRWIQQHPDTLLIVTADHQTGGLIILDGSRDCGRVTGVFCSENHTGVAVPLYATGPGSGSFSGVMENTELYQKILVLLGFNI